MSKATSAEQIRTRLAQWQRAGKRMEELHRAEFQRISTEDAIASFDGLFEYAIENSPIRTHSGLVEQQAVFMKVRDNDQARRGCC